MGLLHSLLIRLGLADLKANQNPLTVFLLDDDTRRHRWFSKRFAGDDLMIAANVAEAKELLGENRFDAIFLDHDLLPHHYESNDHDDFANTGWAIAEFLEENKNLQRSATIIVHTRNSVAGYKMEEKLKNAGRDVEYVPFDRLDFKIKNQWKR